MKRLLKGAFFFLAGSILSLLLLGLVGYLINPNQARRQASIEGDTRFYYSGMLQASVLDTCLPDWQRRAMADGIFLEDLVHEIVST